MRYEWLSEDQIEELVNPALLYRGMAVLNINPQAPTCRVLGAWNDKGELVSFFCIQLFPILGPLLRLDNTVRDNGETSRELTQRMHQFLEGAGVRGYLVVADNPITSRLCERHGMKKMESPVYEATGKSLECNNYTLPTEVM